MAKSVPSTQWFIRVTAPWEHIAAKYLELRSRIDHDSSVIGYHIGKKTAKPHAHICLRMRTEIQKQSIDVSMKKLFGVKGSDYSSKIWDGSNKVISYLHHDDGGKVEYNMPFTDVERAAILETTKVYADIVTTAKEKASTKIPDQVLEAIEASGRTWRPAEIAHFIMLGVRNKTWHAPGDYKLRCFVDEIICRQGKDEEGVNFLVDRFMAKYNS